ncbi:MAG: hypothetical protein IPK16_16530 [Anaerolineales bacterium]|nr:hypothetical protein [Anaerolineales bacterium]
MRVRKTWFAIWIVVIGLIAGCRPVAPVAEVPEATIDPGVAAATKAPLTAENTPEPGGDDMASAPQPVDPITTAAVADLAARLGVTPDQITVVSAEPVVWPDASLGCPQPDMMYAQVLQDGMRIVLSVDGKEYVYHSGETKAPFLCENPAAGG